MGRYFLGVDIGGTKSHAIISDESGGVVGAGMAGPGNHESVGYDGFRRVLHSIVEQAAANAAIRLDEIAGVGLGIAGFDWPSDEEPHRKIITEMLIPAPFAFVNDAVIGLIAGARLGWGISIVAGTGNNCRGRDADGREGRVAGVGRWTGEHGGGGDLVVKAVQGVTMAWTRRGPATQLTERFLAHVGARDVIDLLEGLSRNRYWLGAEAAMLVFEAANEGDAVAQEAIRWVGRELGSMAVGVVRQLQFEALEFDVVLTGSLYKGSPLIAEMVAKTLHEVAPGATLVPLTAPPVVGAVMLGMEQAGTAYTLLRERLVQSASETLYGKPQYEEADE
ncbi:MAG: hypothetical protein J0L63_00240 [Anaerolineae bacterium]|nr:hypothetical protein [Anaerolineae bacterium]